MLVPSATWNKEFKKRISENPERQLAYDKLVDTGANMGRVRQILYNMFVAEFAERKQARLRAALREGKKLHPKVLMCVAEIAKFSQIARAALDDANSISEFDRKDPGQRQAAGLRKYARWLESKFLPTYGKHTSRKKLGTLKSRDSCLVLVVTYLRMVDGRPHYREVALLVEAGAKASGSTNIPHKLNWNWVRTTVKRFERKFPRLFKRAIKPLAAKSVTEDR